MGVCEGCIFHCRLVLCVMQCIVRVRLSLTRVRRRGGSASAVCLLFAVGPYREVHGIYLVRGILFGFVLFQVLFQVDEGRGCGWWVVVI